MAGRSVYPTVRGNVILGLLFAGGILWIFVSGCTTSSCSCGAYGSPQEARAGSAVVFAGEVTDIDHPFFLSREDTTRDTLQVLRVWKGPARRTATVITPRAEDCCGYDGFERGQQYLVYAGNDAGGTTNPGVDGYSTKPLSQAERDLAALGEGERP